VADEVQELRDQIAELRRAVELEEAEVKRTQEALATVEKQLPPVEDGETVVSYGRIADMGKEAADAIRAVTMMLAGQVPDRSKDEMQASFMKFVAWMPEIAGFEENPAEIACFQTAVLGELFGLDETRAAQMEGIIKTHFTALKAGRLTAANAGEPNWRERRSAILTPLLWQLRPFIPADFKSPSVLGQIVNAGAGMETKSETRLSPEPGKSQHSVSMSLPSWPRLPWLPEKKAGGR
jgi:hypothetical protein